MELARRAGGGLGLAYDQGNHRNVIDDEKAARGTLAAVREALTGAKRGGRPASGPSGAEAHPTPGVGGDALVLPPRGRDPPFLLDADRTDLLEVRHPL
jgi:hypothetical protein